MTAPIRKSIDFGDLWAVYDRPSCSYFAEQGVGLHPAALGSFLKSVVLINGRLK
jgi:hypothetical protein